MSIFKGRTLVGIFIICSGIILMTNNLNLTNIDIGEILSVFWPLVLIFIGAKFLVKKTSVGDIATGVILALIGLSFIGRNTGLFYFNISLFWKLFWPSILILFGLSFFMNPQNTGKAQLAILGGIEKKHSSWKLEKNSSYVAFMGGVELDMTVAEFDGDTIVLDLTAIMGGIEIIVPRDLDVHCEGFAVLGGLTLLDKSTGGIISSTRAAQKNSIPSSRQLIIYARAIAGGIDVKTI